MKKRLSNSEGEINFNAVYNISMFLISDMADNELKSKLKELVSIKDKKTESKSIN